MSNGLFNNLTSLIHSEKEIFSEKIKGDKKVSLNRVVSIEEISISEKIDRCFIIYLHLVFDNAKSYIFISVVHLFLKDKYMTFKYPDSLGEDNLEYNMKEITRLYLPYFYQDKLLKAICAILP